MHTWISIVSNTIIHTNTPIVQYYLPPSSQVNKDFLKQVFNDEKKLKKKKEVDYVHVSHYQELSVKNLWKDMKKDVVFNRYFQDDYPDDKGPCRKYFFDILNTLYPDYLEQIMKHAATQRYTAEGEGQQDQVMRQQMSGSKSSRRCHSFRVSNNISTFVICV